MLRTCDAPFQVSAASTRALESLRPVLASLVGSDDWDVQELVKWGSSGAVVTGIEDDEHAVYLGLDTARGQLFLTAKRDALLERAAALAGLPLEPSPYARGDGLLILYRQGDKPTPELESLARRLFSVWLEDRRSR